MDARLLLGSSYVKHIGKNLAVKRSFYGQYLIYIHTDAVTTVTITFKEV